MLTAIVAASMLLRLSRPVAGIAARHAGAAAARAPPTLVHRAGVAARSCDVSSRRTCKYSCRRHSMLTIHILLPVSVSLPNRSLIAAETRRKARTAAPQPKRG
jgi:hypothetical protein